MSQRSQSQVTVFLADNSSAIRERVVAMLVARTATVVGQAQTLQGAIDGILSTRPDVVVLDAQLDGGSGLQVMQAIRPKQPHMPFVVFSSNDEPAYRKRYLEAGAICFLDKGTESDQLAQAVLDAVKPPTS